MTSSKVCRRQPPTSAADMLRGLRQVSYEVSLGVGEYLPQIKKEVCLDLGEYLPLTSGQVTESILCLPINEESLIRSRWIR